jgi:hypothetical protein
MSDDEKYVPTSMPGRHFALVREDLDAYACLLTEAFPDIRFYKPSWDEKRNPEHPPKLRFQKDFASEGYGNFSILWSPEKWKPNWEWLKWGEWYDGMMLWPNGVIECGEGIVPEQGKWPQFLFPGQIYFRCRKDNKEDMRMARKGLRLLTKVASNRNQVMVEIPSMKEFARFEKGNMLWIGHHAREWLLQDPRRMTDISSRSSTQGIRPYS